MIKWYFPKKEHPSRELKFDNNLIKFHGHGIDGVIRENIQNSLDHPVHNGATVLVRMEFGLMPIDDFPDFKTLRDHINSLVGANHYVRDRVNSMQDTLRSVSHQIPYFLYEDTNTLGLSGVNENGIVKNKSFYSYAYLKGSHVESTNEEQEGLRGGSHGIGKIASNAASEIHTMFFANCDEFGLRHTGGSIILIDHEMNGQTYVEDGLLTKFENHDYIPYPSKDFSSILFKEDRGLRIVIPFIKNELKSEKNIKRAVVDSFLLSLIRNQLLVDVCGSIISRDDLEDYIDSSSSEVDFDKDSPTKEYYKTLNCPYNPNFTVLDKRGKKYNFELYLRKDESIRKAKVAIFRRIGMKISDLTVDGTASLPINGVLVSKDKDTDRLLVSMEDESHTNLDPKTVITNENDQKNAIYFLNQLKKELGRIMKQLVEEDFKSEDKFNTSDVLYDLVNRDFKNQIQKKVKPILGDSKSGSFHIVQTSEGEKDRGQSKSKQGKGHKEGPLKPTRIPGFKSNKLFYRLPNYSVHRYSTSVVDVLDISIKDTHYRDSDKINIVFSLVDGDGSEKLNETDLKAISNEILDQNNEQKLIFSNYQIKGISINGYSASIRINHIMDQIDFNKYVIYVEA